MSTPASLQECSLNAMWCAYLSVGATLSSADDSANPRTNVGHAFLNARYYDSQRGQFLSEDPVFWEIGQSQDGKAVLTNPQAMNSYAYGNGNPISNKDQSGRASYLYAALAAYDATIVWDFGADVANNLRNPSLPWYQKLTPQDPDAAIKYNRDAYANVAITMAAVATTNNLAPYVAAGIITQGGSNVLSATVAGLGNVANAYMSGALKNTGDGQTIGQKAMASFEAGFFGGRFSQLIPEMPSYSSVLTQGSSYKITSEMLTEQYCAQADQTTQALFSRLFPASISGSQNSSQQSSKSASTRRKN